MTAPASPLPPPPSSPPPFAPADFCRLLLGALAASDGRRKRRKRDTTPDAIGLSFKRRLLERAAAEAPPPDAFEAWLFAATLAEDSGAQAMAREIFEEWRLAEREPAFRGWLERGSPSDDAETRG